MFKDTGKTKLKKKLFFICKAVTIALSSKYWKAILLNIFIVAITEHGRVAETSETVSA